MSFDAYLKSYRLQKYESFTKKSEEEVKRQEG